MTGITVRRCACIFVINVAQVALHTGVSAGKRERRCAVIEDRSRPGGCVVTGRTLLRESGLRMIRIRRAVVARQMARHAGCR